MISFFLLGAAFSGGVPCDKAEGEYRVFDETSAERVKKFYWENRRGQTVEFVREKRGEYLPLRRGQMSIWEALDLFDTLVDESDPDLSLPQRYHLFQTAEALRRDGHPRWLILTGFIHDLGKILTAFGEPQWAVVGDTFPVGCAYAKENVFSEYFLENPDFGAPLYQSLCGIYEPGCGFDALLMSWGHDEYLYQVVKNYLPEEASYIIRYHSFYPAHLHGAYEHFMNETDWKMVSWLKLFSRYDLYSKVNEKLDLQELLPYYKELVAEFFPEKIDW